MSKRDAEKIKEALHASVFLYESGTHTKLEDAVVYALNEYFGKASAKHKKLVLTAATLILASKDEDIEG